MVLTLCHVIACFCRLLNIIILTCRFYHSTFEFLNLLGQKLVINYLSIFKNGFKSVRVNVENGNYTVICEGDVS